MKILITGGAGYIGSVLVPSLLHNLDVKVRVLDTFSYGDNSLAACCAHNDFEAVRLDVRNHAALKEHAAWPDVVIHLAALVGAPICERNPVDAELVNLRAPLAFFDMLSVNQRIIMPTTESVYGSVKDGVCTEDTPYNPLSLYGKHKVEVEKALLARAGPDASLRLATVFGMSPRMRLDLLVNDFTWRALKDRALVLFEADYRRTYVHVRDVVRAFMFAIDKNLTGVYNIGAVSTSKMQLCKKIQEHVPNFSYVVMGTPPKDAIGRDPDQRDYIVSDAKIRAAGYAPMWGLDEGVRELLSGYRTLSNNRHGNIP